MGVMDNNPLYGQYTFGGGYTACPTLDPGGNMLRRHRISPYQGRGTYFADFLFGTTSAYALANFFEAHLRETLQSVYAQDDWKVCPTSRSISDCVGSTDRPTPKRTTTFPTGTRSARRVNRSPGAVAGNGITPISAGGVYGKTLVNPDYDDFAPRIGFAYSPVSNISVRGGFGLGFVHYTRAGSGDILAINAPQAQFAAVTQAARPDSGEPLRHTAAGADHSDREHCRVAMQRSIRDFRAAWSRASTRRRTISPGSRRTPVTATLRTTTSRSSASSSRTAWLMSPMSATMA